MNSTLHVGVSTLDITPQKLLPLQGQMHLRMATHTRDPLHASAAAFSQDDLTVVIMSCDLAMLPDDFVKDVQLRCEQRLGVTANNLMLAATHTHVGPCMHGFRDTQILDAEYIEWLRKRLVECVALAIEDLQPAELYQGKGWLEEMGFNRRGLHHGGKCDMYWGSWKDGFEGVEGPRDGDVPVLTVKDLNGRVRCVLTGFATHPNCLESEYFYSADLVGETRRHIQNEIDSDVVVVYLTGAAGDTAPSVMLDNPENHQPWRGEAGVVRSGEYLGQEVVRQIHAAKTPMNSPALRMVSDELQIPLRPWPEGLDPNDETQVPAGVKTYYEQNIAIWPDMLATQNPASVRLNVIRIGEVAVCTNPAELYCEFGLAIKQNSPAALTFISELTDGYCGYVPTKEAFDRGGYSTWPAPTAKLSHDAGERITRCIHDLLPRVFS